MRQLMRRERHTPVGRRPTAEEITQAVLNNPTMRRNRKGRPCDYCALGHH
ncbi:MAG: hypothetical protein ACRDRN_23910 [Sciscionella sp.]